MVPTWWRRLKYAGFSFFQENNRLLDPVFFFRSVVWAHSKGDFWLRRCENFFVFSTFDDHAVLCAVKSDKQKFKVKAFINRWSASQIKHMTAKSNSRLRQKILFDIDYQSFAVGESPFVSRCRRSRWRFVRNEFLASTFDPVLSCSGVCFSS